jgi:hypothetical protein
VPQTRLIFFQEAPGKAPVLQWLLELSRNDKKAYAKCAAVLERLVEFGHELRRPIADYLREGIYELRVRRGRVNYRVLYFFHGRQVAVLAAALTKEGSVPPKEIDRAIRRKQLFEQDPEGHSHEEPQETSRPH